MVDVASGAGAADSPAVKVGVRLELASGKLGEWLADAAAFDAGGVDALWIDAEPELDVLALTAALAVVTFRARLVVMLRDAGAAGLGRTLDTIGRLSHGRLALVADVDQGAECAAPDVETFRRVPGGFEGTRERWVSVPVPDGRQSWRAARAEAAERGAHGVIVPADPRLLDMLRNPDDPGERRDLQLAQG